MPVATLGNAGGPMDWFNALPKVTRTYGLLTVVVAAMISWNMPHVQYLLLDWRQVFYKFQIWRVVTHIVIVGPFGFNFLLQLLWIFTYGTQLESVVYEHHPEDLLFLYIFCTLALSALSLVCSPFVLGLLPIAAGGRSMVMVLLYLWSKEFPEENIKLYGIVSIQGFYLPFAFLGIQILMGQSPIAEGLGIMVGHAWYFLTNLLPRGTGREVLPTPNFVRQLALRMGLQAAPPPQRPGAAQPQAGPPLFRAFTGRANRLS